MQLVNILNISLHVKKKKLILKGTLISWYLILHTYTTLPW